MIDTAKLEELIAQYKIDFPKHWDEEKYKWEAVKCFQDNWDIDAPNFLEMFTKATEKTANLLTSYMCFPKGMIEKFISIDAEYVRNMFRNLFDEKLSLEQRTTDFKNSADTILSEKTTDKNHYQDANSISTYLWLKYPDKYYICKYSECKKVIEKLNIDIDFKKGNLAQNIINCKSLYDKICNYLQKNNDLIQLLKNRLENDCYPDPYLKTLTVDFCFRISRNDDKENIKSNLISQDSNSNPHYWMYSPGEKANHWEEFYNEGIMAIGWDELDNLSLYNSKDEIAQAVQKAHNITSYPRNDVAAINDFVNNIKVGDIVYAKKGMYSIIARGIVTSDYEYDENRKDYKNIHKVNWEHVGNWEHPGKAVIKTLTDITKYKDYVEELENLILNNKTVEKSPNNNTHYWWLNANPKIWSFNNIGIGDVQNYTLLNENGNKRRVYQNFLDAKEGDTIICYESNPVKQIVALGKVSKGNDGEKIYFEKTEQLETPIDYQILKSCAELENMEFFVNSNGSLFKLTSDEYNFIMDLIRENNPIIKNNEELKSYNKKDFLNEVFIQDYDTLVNILNHKKNLILQGAPGVGKTFAAKRLAYSIIGKKDNSHIAVVQFHQNYSYEDFIMGYKPQENGFTLENGIFFQFCQKAQNNPSEKYFFIIDEINRGNMSKIFGELLMLIEKDYRGIHHKLIMPYNKQPFYVPENLYIIGMMNTADRSLAMIDYALRRRFSFFTICPGFASDGFRKYQEKVHNENFDRAIALIKELNQEIEQDESLGQGFCIGHSYFCLGENCSYNDDWLKCVIEYEIIPMLEEYWFDNSEKLNTWKKRLKGLFNVQ